VFVKTIGTGAIQLVSAAAGGTEGDWGSEAPAFSPDGTKVAFSSDRASNLVPGAKGGVFLKTLATGAIDMVATPAGGTIPSGPQWARSPAFSPDGTELAFQSEMSILVPGDTTAPPQVVLKTLG
jgi:Tol biopolymer transport system component